MNPKIVYYEEESLNYPLGKNLFEKFKSAEWIKIENHNNIHYLVLNNI
ncbi:MAG TPA: hypothetical protein PLW11_11800 [Bacillota bacterium]|nr:hypothetical protein [Bacillota bacterium]